jgi:alpha-beta hydrolase superfamily lysophospholipase
LPQVFKSALQENSVKTAALKEMEALYPDFTAPTLLFHAVDDGTIPFPNSQELIDIIQSEKRSLVRTDGLRHQLQEAAPKMLYNEIQNFITSNNL